jgi:hypothetical protein
MSVSPTPASPRGRSLLGLVAPALWVAALLLAPGRACGQFRLFDLGSGADYLSELQKSLTISSSSGTVTIFDPQDGSTVTSPLDGDPRLLNRKFDIEWQMSGPGVRLPFTLSTPHVIGGAAIRPTLTLEALEGDFDLRFLNQRESSPNDGLHGRGPMYGVELALRAESRTWFAETGYRYHSLPSTAADRSQPFTSPGAEVLTDESRLSRETQDAFTRVGYSPSEGLFTYTGVRYRKANVEIEDDLRFVDALQRETTLSSRTKLDGSATEAMVGVEGRRGSFTGRTEITFNDKDYGVLVTVVYKGSEFSRNKIDEFGVSVASQLAQIEADFRARRQSLTIVSSSPEGPIYLAAEVALLLDSTEARLLNVLHLKELAPIRASIQFRFRRFRKDLGIIPPVVGASPPMSDARSGIAFAAYRLAQADPDRSLSKADKILNKIGDLLLRATGLASTGGLTLKLCVDSLPRGASYRLRPGGPQGRTAEEKAAARGNYSCVFSYEGSKIPIPKNPDDPDHTCIDLWETDGNQLMECNLRTQTCALQRSPPLHGCSVR